jgi:hypothetical protein
MRKFALAVCVMAGFAALAWAAPEGASSQDTPGVEPGDIVIKPTGKKRIVRTAQPTTKPATTQAEVRDDSDDDAPPARVVSIGYLLREPEERGRGPQIHYADYYYPAYSSCAPTYTSPLWGSSCWGSSSYYGRYRDTACRTTSFEWCRRR